ncbi:MAG: hypothetical protein AAFV45_09795 [Pseudomonadota bacterium]
MSLSQLNSNEDAPPCVYLLADHLDAALAAGEDLVEVGKSWDDGDPCDPCVAGVQRWAIGRIRAHEMTLLSRMLRARERAAELSQIDTRFKLLAHLFVSGTADLADAVAETCDLSECAFENGDDATAYLRARGLLDAEAPGLTTGQTLNLGDAFLVVGRVPLGIVLDLVSEFLETLDLYFSLYPNEATADVEVADVTVAAAPAAVGDDAKEDGSDDAALEGPANMIEADSGTDDAHEDDGEVAVDTALPSGQVLTVVGPIPGNGVHSNAAL